MVGWCVLMLVAFEVRADSPCAEPARPNDARRVEDFYKLRREADERSERIERAAAEVRGRGREREEILEAARLEYVRTKRAKPDDPHAEAAWRDQIHAREVRREDARACFVHARANARRAPEIPGNTEFGLDE